MKEGLASVISLSAWRGRRSLGGMARHIIVAVLAVAGIFSGQEASADDSPLIMGVLPRRTPSEMMEMYSPLAKHLSRELGRPVKLETTPDFRTFWEAVAAKRFHIVHYNQYHYVRSHKESGYQVIAKNEEVNKSTMAGVLLVRKDSGFKSLQDLRGKRIIFGGDKQALMSYIIPTYLLREAGLKKDDYTEEFALNPPNVALTVFFRRADAGGIGDIVFDTAFVSDKIDVSKMEYLAKGEQVAHLPWAVRADIPMAERERIQKTLLGVKASADGPRILKAAALTNLVGAEDSEYNVIRKVISTVTGENY